MSSPSLKRLLDFELNSQNTSGTNSSSGIGSNGHSPVAGLLPSANPTNKRRCTSPPTITNAQTIAQAQNNSYTSISPFKDSSTIIDSRLEDAVAELIQDELNTVQKAHSHPQCNESTTTTAQAEEPPILTARQTQSICKKLIKEREQALRSEYDRILARKLAEQYYLNSYVESARLQPPDRVAAANLNPPIHQYQQQQQHGVTPTVGSLLLTSNLDEQQSVCEKLIKERGQTLRSEYDIILARKLAEQYYLNSYVESARLQPPDRVAAATQNPPLHQYQQQQQHGVAPTVGPVLLASNLDEQLATPEALFTLFGVFGDVTRVKILFNKKDNALVQMADANQAQVAQGYLDKQRIFGKVIRVTRSKHLLVQLPREGNQFPNLTKDFTNSPLHRFKIPGSRNHLNIYPPSNTLHISNIPPTVDESSLQKKFRDESGLGCTSFKFFPKDRKMALMKFNSVEHATIVLIKMHNFAIAEDAKLRVSFSKSAMQT